VGVVNNKSVYFNTSLAPESLFSQCACIGGDVAPLISPEWDCGAVDLLSVVSTYGLCYEWYAQRWDHEETLNFLCLEFSSSLNRCWQYGCCSCSSNKFVIGCWTSHSSGCYLQFTATRWWWRSSRWVIRKVNKLYLYLEEFKLLLVGFVLLLRPTMVFCEFWLEDAIWIEYFTDPNQWWDNQFNKRNLMAPNSKHQITKRALWVDGGYTPDCVKDGFNLRSQ
jgi:hypothetical protein